MFPEAVEAGVWFHVGWYGTEYCWVLFDQIAPEKEKLVHCFYFGIVAGTRQIAQGSFLLRETFCDTHRVLFTLGIEYYLSRYWVPVQNPHSL